ncbi:unnamed protein product [Zymoseptoria tritici ST99CH_1A5]|uniref:Nucleoporin NUP37 n=1 Tax=Zymoseptoria tritici ST99CH_1A5 TaxID=1276529 RepID=A0A1Y6LZX2_ZYMTR|nr:unnamed protein product [Zymoseptoria tritici ST99CH_3D1]SMY29159.1 unnamed protein product [Zymoseptoria tritici ST99CH_1A5]
MESVMRPRVSKRDRKLHVSYELPHRIHCARIYPVTAPNGSTVVIYGYDKGVRVLWRGGRRRKEHDSRTQSSATPNGNGHSHEIISLDNDDDDAADAAEDEYEAEEEEQDADCPYPTIIEDLDIEVGTNVLHVEVPAVHVSSLTPSILRKTAIVVIGSSDGTIRILQIPLAPPSEGTKDSIARKIGRSQIELSAGGSVPASLAIKYLPADDSRSDTFAAPKHAPEDQILVASVSRALSIWSVAIGKNGLAAHDDMLLRRAQMHFPANGVTFHPSSRLAQVLVTDTSGTARIYDPHTSRSARRRPATGDSVAEPSNAPIPTGDWIMTYHTAFNSTILPSEVEPVSPRRKKILDARWVISGKAILTVLEDGEWGIWDVTTAPPGKRVEEFTVRGFLGTSSTLEQSEPAKPKRGASKLAPMTPNTRKTKSEELFAGTPKMVGVAPPGGISVAPNYSRTGQSDESVVIWYNSEIYSITSMQSFWQRSTTGASGGFGSLYAPGLSHITDINLNNELITSVSHFSANTSAGLGQMNTQRDILVSAEHRIIALQTIRPASSVGRTLFQQPAEVATAKDQQMLDAGAMDLDAMDRMLDDMAGGAATTTRKVGFAS